MSEAPMKKRDLAELGASTLAGLLLDNVRRDEALASWARGKLSGISSETLAGRFLSNLNDYETLKSRLRQILAECEVDELVDALFESVGKDRFLRKEAQRALVEAREKPEEAAADIRAEIEALQPEEMLEPWWELETMIDDVEELIQRIEKKVGKKAPGIAFDLLLSILHLTPEITDAILRYGHMSDIDEDRGEELADTAYMAFRHQACSIAEVDPSALADKIFDLLIHDIVYYGSTHADAIREMAYALGEQGLDRLKERCDSFDAAAARANEISVSGHAQVQERADEDNGGCRSAVKAIRKEVANLQGRRRILEGK